MGVDRRGGLTMSAPDTSVDIEWGSDVVRCQLDIPRMKELEAKVGMPIARFAAALLETGEWKLPHLEEIIRLGMIGGGASAMEAQKRMQDGLAGQTIVEILGKAVMIFIAGFSGKPAADGSISEGNVPAAGSRKSTSPRSKPRRS